MGSPWVNHVSPGAEIARSHVWHLHRLQHGRPGRTGPGLKVSRRSEQRQGLLMKPRFQRLQRLGRCRPGWVLQNGTPWGPETAWFFLHMLEALQWLYLAISATSLEFVACLGNTQPDKQQTGPNSMFVFMVSSNLCMPKMECLDGSFAFVKQAFSWKMQMSIAWCSIHGKK